MTIGNFDGVHRGHQHLIETAFKRNAEVQVLTFHPHPLQVLKPEFAPARLFDYQDQEQQLRALGVSNIQILQFTEEFAKLSGREFFTAYIARPGVENVVVGENFRFGCDRKAGLLELQQWGSELGLGVTTVTPLCVDSQPVSSSRIRESLAQADLVEAEKLLNRSYQISGTVVSGEKRGRQLGFPTANLQLAPEMKDRLALQRGVYCGRDLQKRRFVLNVGINPTVSATQALKVEAHFLDYPDDPNFSLYGEQLKLNLSGHLRPEKRFENLQSLRAQIQKDIHEAESRLKT